MPKPSSHQIFATPAGWRAWLEAHYAGESELWLAIYKKGSGKTGITYEQAVEEALCYGWIDGQAQTIDESKYAVRFTPRKPGSVWSQSNIQRVEKLVREGRMAEPGLRKVAEAQASGEWQAAIRREETDTLPPDLEQALSTHEGALAGFIVSDRPGNRGWAIPFRSLGRPTSWCVFIFLRSKSGSAAPVPRLVSAQPAKRTV